MLTQFIAGLTLSLILFFSPFASTALAQSNAHRSKTKPPKLSFSPNKLDFGDQIVSLPSPSKTITVTNPSSTEAVTITSIDTSAPFMKMGDNCTPSIPASGTCMVEVVFAPTQTGKFKVKKGLTFTDSAQKSPQEVVGLEGTGIIAVFNKAFVTSATFTGDLGGQAGADADCAAAAKAAGLSGTFKAWLSTSKLNAKDKLGTARGFVRVDGQPFADQVSDIVAGTIFNPLDIDENGVESSKAVWTGTLPAGTVGTQTCSDWTSNSFEVFGGTGVSSFGPTYWTGSIDQGNSCTSTQSLYCFDTSHVTPLTVTKTPGRIAFVSKADFNTIAGIAGADALCAAEASAASLSGTFQALLSTSTTPAASRSGFDFSPMSEPYVRPDGIKLADAPTIATGASLDSGIWQNADGTYVTAFSLAWTGSSTPSITSAETCDDWSSNSFSVHGDDGFANDSAGWWSSGSTNCGFTGPIYCLQE